MVLFISPLSPFDDENASQFCTESSRRRSDEEAIGKGGEETLNMESSEEKEEIILDADEIREYLLPALEKDEEIEMNEKEHRKHKSSKAKFESIEEEPLLNNFSMAFKYYLGLDEESNIDVNDNIGNDSDEDNIIIEKEKGLLQKQKDHNHSTTESSTLHNVPFSKRRHLTSKVCIDKVTKENANNLFTNEETERKTFSFVKDQQEGKDLICLHLLQGEWATISRDESLYPFYNGTQKESVHKDIINNSNFVNTELKEKIDPEQVSSSSHGNISFDCVSSSSLSLDDPILGVIGSTEATTCHIVAFHHRITGSTALVHLDSENRLKSMKEDMIENLITKSRLQYEKTLSSTKNEVEDDISQHLVFDVYIVGGYNCHCSNKITYNLLYSLASYSHKQFEVHFRLRFMSTSFLNSIYDGSLKVHRPRFTSFFFNIFSRHFYLGTKRNYSFTTPQKELRGSRLWCSHLQLIDADGTNIILKGKNYDSNNNNDDSEEEDSLVAVPVYRSNNINSKEKFLIGILPFVWGRRHISSDVRTLFYYEYLTNLSNDELLSQTSTSPLVEDDDYPEDVRAKLDFLRRNYYETFFAPKETSLHHSKKCLPLENCVEYIVPLTKNGKIKR